MAESDSMMYLQPEFTPSFSSYAKAIRLDAVGDVRQDAEAVFQYASQHLKPKAMIKPEYITAKHTSGSEWEITIGDTLFRGKALGALKDVHRVFLYVATCGNEMEGKELPSQDMLAPYWLEEIKLQALHCVRRACKETLKNRYNLNRPLSLNPGSGNVDIWPVEQLSGIFSLIGGGESIGVRLTESSLMIPNKTVAGLYFATQESDYDSCAYCERKNCPDRRVPFQRVL